jgi:molecular chaperone Hsp33
MSESILFPAPDSVLRITLMDARVRVFMVRATRMAQEAADIHQASDTAACAMGRLLSACAMMDAMNEGVRLTVSVSGGGAGGRMTCGAQEGRLKIAVQYPQAELPPTADGKLDVAEFVGRKGQLVVVKDFGEGEPFTSLSAIVSGELGEDFAHYFTVSEQKPSLVALGCLNQDGVVLSAGGILIQPMPGCPDRVITDLENRIPFFANISREIFDRDMAALAMAWFRGLEPVIAGEENVVLQCDCTREKMLRALTALGEEELRDIVQKGEPTHITCHFCRAERSFEAPEIEAILQGGNLAAD